MMEIDKGVAKLAHHPRVGLVYDDRMCKHFDPNDENHVEKPDRIKAIWAKLKSQGITQRCIVMKAKEAEDRNITLVHKQKYVDLIKNSSSKTDSKREKIASKFDDIYLNKGSSQSAYLAAGAVIKVSEKIAKGELDSAVAIVRPPGHHAEVDTAMGFCFFNNVAIAASVLINENPELGISKILIVDWDVHHGNGTQKMFWEDPRVLVFNVHRHDSGNFFPHGNDGSHSMTGEGSGTGYNVNVPWEQGNYGDADYFAVWDHVLIPITKAFHPDMILISGGFDAAACDTIGGCSVTPEGYSVMMKKLMAFARGRIMMALEGGYNLESLSKSVLACVEALLENKPIIGSAKAEASPMESTWRVIEAVRKELSRYWPMLGHELPKTHKRTSSSEGRTKVLTTKGKRDLGELGRAAFPVLKKRSVPQTDGSQAPVHTSAKDLVEVSFVSPAAEESTGAPAPEKPSTTGEPLYFAPAAEAAPVAKPASVGASGSAQPGTSGEDLIIDPALSKILSRAAGEVGEGNDKDILLSLAKFASPNFPPLASMKPNEDRNRQHGLIATCRDQGLLIEKLKHKVKVLAGEKREYVAKMAGVEIKLAQSDEKVISLDCQLETCSKEKEQANAELMQALSLVSAKDSEIAEVRASFNEILPAKISCESRILELEEELRQREAAFMKEITASCKAYAIQITQDYGLPPPEFEDEESEDLGLESSSGEENPADSGEDDGDAPAPAV